MTNTVKPDHPKLTLSKMMRTRDILRANQVDHPKLAQFLKEYRAKHGIESVQVKKDGTLHPLKAAKVWTEYLKASK